MVKYKPYNEAWAFNGRGSALRTSSMPPPRTKESAFKTAYDSTMGRLPQCL